jgi:hypothetical protein
VLREVFMYHQNCKNWKKKILDGLSKIPEPFLFFAVSSPSVADY